MLFVFLFLSAGVYGLFVPYFNGIFSGKVARINALEMSNVQEVDLMVDRVAPDTLKGTGFCKVICFLRQNSRFSLGMWGISRVSRRVCE